MQTKTFLCCQCRFTLDKRPHSRKHDILMLSTLFFPSIRLNSTVPSHCSSPGTRSQPATKNADITATVGSGIQFLVMTSQHCTIYFHDDAFWLPDTLPHLAGQKLCKQHDHLIHLHRCLQSCVGTRARLGYWLHLMCNCGKRICHYTVYYMYVCVHICYMLVTTCLCVRSSWYEYAWCEYQHYIISPKKEWPWWRRSREVWMLAFSSLFCNCAAHDLLLCVLEAYMWWVERN